MVDLLNTGGLIMYVSWVGMDFKVFCWRKQQKLKLKTGSDKQVEKRNFRNFIAEKREQIEI